MKNILLISIYTFLLIPVCFSAQNEQVDSLKKVVGSQNDTAVFNALLELSGHYQFNNFDSATYYVGMAEQLMIKSDRTEKYPKALFVHGNILYANNFYQEALDYFTKALDLAPPLVRDCITDALPLNCAIQ